MDSRPRKIKERRHHIVFVTRNTEYHCRDRECVGVRDRTSGSWRRRHPALRGKLLGAVEATAPVLRRPREGLRLVFEGRGMVMTSPVLQSGRPFKEDIFSYTSLCCAGAI